MSPAASPTEAQIPSRRPPPQPIELPPLGQSDPLIRELAATLSRHPLLARLAATPSVVRAMVLAVVQIGDGKTPAKALTALEPPGELTLSGTKIDPATYARWNGAVTALTSVNPVDAAQIYVNVKRIFDEAYAELGYPNSNFDEAIVRAIRTLDQTPTPPADWDRLAELHERARAAAPEERRALLAALGDAASTVRSAMSRIDSIGQWK